MIYMTTSTENDLNTSKKTSSTNKDTREKPQRQVVGTDMWDSSDTPPQIGNLQKEA